MARPVENIATAAAPRPRRPRLHAGQALLATLLMLTGLTTISACVLAPPWRQHCRLVFQKQRLQRQLRRTESQLHDVQRQIAALQSEPAFCEQIAITYLGYCRPGQQYFITPAVTEKRNPQTPPSLPPAGPLMRLLTNRTQRAVLLAGAIMLVVTGLVLLSTGTSRTDSS